MRGLGTSIVRQQLEYMKSWEGLTGPMRKRCLLTTTFFLLKFCPGNAFAEEEMVTCLPIPGAPVVAISIDRTAPNRIVVSTRDHGVFFSSDGGTSWNFQFGIRQNAAEQIPFDPENRNRVYMANTYRRFSVGNVETGTLSYFPSLDGLPHQKLFGIACGRRIKGSLYGLCRDGSVKPYLFTPEDSTWHLMMEGLENDSLKIHTIHENPLDSNVYLSTSEGLYGTGDKPDAWTLKTSAIYRSNTNLGVYSIAVNQATNQIVGLTDDSLVFYSPRYDTLYAFPRPDSKSVQALEVVHDESNTVFAVVDFRLHRVTGGSEWEKMPIDASVWSLATDPQNPDIVFAWAYEKGLHKSVDRGRTWTNINQGLNYWADMSDIAVDHTDNSILYVALQDYVMKSEDRGLNWRRAATFSNAPYRLTMSPADPRVIYGGCFGRPFRTFDGFETMDRLVDDKVRLVREIRIHPLNPKLLFALPYDGSGLSRSSDSGETWSSIPAPIEEGRTYEFVLDPDDPGHLLVQCKLPSEDLAALEIFETLDTGRTWTSVCDSFSYEDMLVDPHAGNLIAYDYKHNPSVVYSEDGREWAGMDTAALEQITRFAVSPHTPGIRVGASKDGSIPITINDGQYWYDLSSRFPAGAHVERFRFDPVDENCLYVITREYGLFRVRLDLIPDDETGSEKPAPDHRPVWGDVPIRIRHGKLRLEELPFAPERLRLYSVGGRRVLDQRTCPGRLRCTVPVGEVPTGMYVLNITGRNESTVCRFTKKISIMHPTE